MENLAKKLFKTAPISTLHIVTGVGLWSLNTAGIVPYRYILFHPQLVQSEPYRLLLAPMVTGENMFEVVNASFFQVVMWHIPLEALIRRQSTPSSQPPNIPLDSVKNLIKFIKNDRYTHIVCSSIATICILEILTDGGSTTRYLRPYTLFPTLDLTLKWVYSFMSSKSIMVYNFIPVRPIYLCLVSALMQGVDRSLKSLVTALGVAYMYQLKREDGQACVDWFWDFCGKWYKWTSGVMRPKSERIAEIDENGDVLPVSPSKGVLGDVEMYKYLNQAASLIDSAIL